MLMKLGGGSSDFTGLFWPDGSFPNFEGFCVKMQSLLCVFNHVDEFYRTLVTDPEHKVLFSPHETEVEIPLRESMSGWRLFRGVASLKNTISKAFHRK